MIVQELGVLRIVSSARAALVIAIAVALGKPGSSLGESIG